MNWTETVLLAGLVSTVYLLIKAKRKKPPAEASRNLTDVDIDQLQEVFQKVEKSMVDDKIFLRKNLKISELAEEVHQNEKMVSRAINHFSSGNFNSMINNFRVEKAEEMISSGEFEHYTIEAIADESGFANKVSFYHAFKGRFGMSPKEYWALKQSANQRP